MVGGREEGGVEAILESMAANDALPPEILAQALEVLDTSKDGEIDEDEWEVAIQRGLKKRVEQLQAEQERRMRAAAAADEEFSAEFLSAARKVFEMIDVDNSGTLTKQEIIFLRKYKPWGIILFSRNIDTLDIDRLLRE